MKNKQKKQLFITIAIILILIAVFCLIHFLNRTKMNSGYVNGNSAGNLYNGGLFCESNGTVFFSNPSDNHRLYSMNPDGSDMKKLSDDTVSYINADDHYVYYVRNNKTTQVFMPDCTEIIFTTSTMTKKRLLPCIG